MAVAIYKPENIVVNIEELEVTGLAMQTPVAISFDDAKVTKTQDRNNGGIYNVRATQGGTITLNVMGNDYWNVILSNLSLTGSTFSITVQDRNDYDNKPKFACVTAMVQGLPSYDYDEEIATIEYVIECINLEMINVNPDVIPNWEKIFG